MRPGSCPRVVLLDFEFATPAGEMPGPLCFVAYDETNEVWISHWFRGEGPHEDILCLGSDDVLVAHAAQAELLCLRALGWSLPGHVIDTYAEHRVLANGTSSIPRFRSGLVDALASFGGRHMYSKDEKSDLQELAGAGGPFTRTLELELLAYCFADVVAERDLYNALRPHIDAGQAELRGRFVALVAEMEERGVPIDLEAHRIIRERWTYVLWYLAYSISGRYPGVYRMGPPNEVPAWDSKGWETYIAKRGIRWPRLTSGALADDKDTWSDQVRLHPELKRLYEARKTIKRMRRMSLAVGADGRNRASIKPFRSRTGRCQPSPAESIFGMAKWLRCLVRPGPGMAVAYVDWVSAEFGIGAAMSGDANMQRFYREGDPYAQFAKKVGAILGDTEPEEEQLVRDLYKIVVLAVGYGQGAYGLSKSLGAPTARAEQLIAQYRRTFSRFVQWCEDQYTSTIVRGKMMLWPLGWRIRVDDCPREVLAAQMRTIKNWKVQSMGSELLRLAALFAQEDGLALCMTVHDAMLIEAPIDRIDDDAKRLEAAMARASRELLGFELRTEVKVVKYPERFADKKGVELWRCVATILGMKP